MKKLLFLSPFLGMALAAPTTYIATAGKATFVHKVAFVDVYGTIAGVSAEVQLDPSDLAQTTGIVTVPLADLKTGNTLRDSHTKSEVALHTARFPTATFQLEKLMGGVLLEGQTLATTATGKLTIKGISKPANIPVKATLQGGVVNIATQFKFNPRVFQVNYPGSSDSVVVGVQFTLRPK